MILDAMNRVSTFANTISPNRYYILRADGIKWVVFKFFVWFGSMNQPFFAFIQIKNSDGYGYSNHLNHGLITTNSFSSKVGGVFTSSGISAVSEFKNVTMLFISSSANSFPRFITPIILTDSSKLVTLPS